jgi:hypothetical protein
MKVQNPNESSSDEWQLPEKQPTQGDLNRTAQADFSKHKLEKIVADGEGK